MKILIKLDDSRAIVIPAELAGAAATIVAQGVVMKKDYYSGNNWKIADENAVIEFMPDVQLEPLSEREQKLIKEASDKNSMWASAYTANEATKKRLAEVELELATVRSLTTCKTADPEPAEETEIIDEDES